MKYFYLTELPSKEDFILKFNSKEFNKKNYPIINSILNDEELQNKMRLMKYLPKINELCNYIINFVSYRFSREDAKKKSIENLLDDNKNNLLKEFIPIYNEISQFLKQKLVNGFQKMEFEKLKLIDLCVDSNEKGFGYNIYLIYKEMIDWQNSFINFIINSGKQKIQKYKEIFDSKIMIQDCEEDQILDLPKLDDYIKNKQNNNENINDKNKYNLLKIIFDYSYKKENKIKYDYEQIENSLFYNIFPKLKSFKNEIRNVIFQYECFIGDRSKIIMDFKNKYHQRKLNEIELEAVIRVISENKKYNKYDIKNILFSFHILIDIILDQSPDINKSLYSIISTVESNDITDIIKNFFETIIDNMKNKDSKYLNISCFIDLMDLLELSLWNETKINLEQKYKEDISEIIKNHFKHLDDKKKMELCSAIRKFIYRYLSVKKGENIYKINNNLKENLLNADLWEHNEELIANNEEFIAKNVNIIFGDLEVNVSQAFKLYEYLGGDEAQFNAMINKYNNEKLNNKEKFEKNERVKVDDVDEEIKLNDEEKNDDSISGENEEEYDNSNDDGDDD